VCGSRRVFESWFALADACARCEFEFDRAEGLWLGAVGMNTIVTLLLLFPTIVLGFVVTWPDPPAIPLAGLALGVSVVVPLLFYPVSYTLWSSVDLAMRPLEPGEAPGR